jgi:hypothetical protein
MEIEQVVARLRALKDASKSVFFSPPCSDDEIQSIGGWLRSSAGISLPVEYEYVLRCSNGLQIENDFILDASNFRLQNEELHAHARFQSYVLLGHEGNVACWAHDASLDRFVISGGSAPDKVIEEYSSFAALLTACIKTYFAVPTR